MKKIYGFLVVAIFLMSTFLAINLYNSTSFPGYGGNKECNYCHNQPAFAKTVDASFNLGNFTQANQVFTKYGQWATDEVPTIPTNNRSESNLEFVKMSFLKNSTDIMVMAQVPDSTYNATSSATSDKFGIIFNIDVANFSVGQFLNNYNSTTNDLNNVLSGQMEFTSGHADFWYVDMSKATVNGTGLAQDKYISTGILSDGAGTTNQDVHVGIYYGKTGYSTGYQYFFVRHLKTNDINDVQFNVEGVGIHYAIAHWDASSMTYHLSSFDQMIVVGDNIVGAKIGAVINTIYSTTVNNTYSTTYSEAASISSTVSAFTIVIVLALVAVALPIITYFFKPRK